ncbi:hypothetical protein Vadar_030491 [Vaccinium darrowii]|uniref:Uncharacterized protein n=1 Tax=Vaccinium darrowii TaxID=229202 RepID=A0ACB7X576_9ERIC|nr:hypothetical protein Vadar_030491 [Vaccinium darrowii]
MSSQQTSQSKPSKGKGKSKVNETGNEKEKQSRRLWSLKEEEVLLECMLDEFKDGVKWRADNGFKPGFFGAVEILFHKMMPGTTIRANPNIESKVKNWKEKYGLLADMQRLSGFSWNHDTNSVIVDSPDVWEDYVKDRATGEMAEDPAEIRDDGSDEEIEEVGHDESFVGTNDCYTPRFANGEFVHGGATFVDLCAGGSQAGNPSTPTSYANATTPTSNANASTANAPLKKAKKMTKAELKQAALNEALGSYMADTKEVMVKLVDAVSFEQKLSDKRNGVFGHLQQLKLQMEEIFTANAMILASDKKVDEFYSIPEAFRQPWVEMLLKGLLAPKIFWAAMQFSGIIWNFLGFNAVFWAVMCSFLGCYAVFWALMQFSGLFLGCYAVFWAVMCSFLGCYAVFWALMQFSGLFLACYAVFCTVLQFAGLFYAVV